MKCLSFLKRGNKILVAALLAAALVSFPVRSEADRYELIRSPQTPSGTGDFLHNVFSDAAELADDGLPTGTGGNSLGWFTLDTSYLNWYDPTTGGFDAKFLVFENAGDVDPVTGAPIGTAIGSVRGVGAGIYGLASGEDPNLGDNEDMFDPGPPPAMIPGNLSDLLVGYIDWSFSGLLNNATYRTAFADHDYSDALENGNVFRVNSESSASLFLFGSAGTYDGMGKFSNSNFTVDMVLEAGTTPLQAVPEPGTLVLLATGFAGLIGYRRRRV